MIDFTNNYFKVRHRLKEACIFVFSILMLTACVSPSAVIQLQEQVSKLKVDSAALNERLSKLEESAEKPTPEAISAPLESTPVPPPASPLIPKLETMPVPATASAEELYEKGRKEYQQGKFRESQLSFQQAQLTSSDAEFDSRCIYWIGECLYSQGAFQRALELFVQIQLDYPTSAKYPDALMKIGFTYYELKEYDQCVKVLEDFLGNYPDHESNSLVRDKIKAAKQVKANKSKADSTHKNKESRR